MTGSIHDETENSGTISSTDAAPDPGLNTEQTAGQSNATRIFKDYQSILEDCNKAVVGYRKGDIAKAKAYTTIHKRLSDSLGEDTDRIEESFESFIATIESHDTEVQAAARRGGGASNRRRDDTPEADAVDNGSDDEAAPKRLKVDESVFPWNANPADGAQVLSGSLKSTLKSIEQFSIDPKSTKRSLTNSPACPEFPDSEWKNVIAGRAVSLDAVLSGQFSTANNDTRTERMGDLEITFGSVEPTKTVRNGGDWSIAWNKTVNATAFAFPHRRRELTDYGEYITSLFAATNQSFHSRVIAFDKAVRRRIGSVRNIELSDHHRFADLKLAHIDSIGVSVGSGESSKAGGNRGKGQKGRGGKKEEPCNKWNDGTCLQAQEECRRQHVCNVCGKQGHKGKECRKQGH
jgi:hypothetical protein